MDGGSVRASLIQIGVDPDEPVTSRRDRAASLVRNRAEADVVVLPELWTVGAFAFDRFEEAAESAVDGPTAWLMSAAAADARVWLHAGSVVERAPDGTLYNTSLLFAPDGQLAATYRKIHRFGFDRGEAVLLGAGADPVTVAVSAVGAEGAEGDPAVLGLATCYDLRFPELFRLLTEAGANVLVVPAGWPDKRAAHWSLLARARAVENQSYVLACGTAGSHAGVPQAGRSAIIDPWGEALAEASDASEQIITADLNLGRLARIREEFPVLRDRVLR